MLRLDNYVKSKKIAQKGFVLDRRRLKVGRSREEITLNHIEQELLELKMPAVGHLARELFKIKGIEKLNHRLMAIVYTYFEKRNFDFANVVMEFNRDFNDELQIMIENDNFRNLDLKDKNKIFEFRRDFITYLFVIDKTRTDDIEEESTKMNEETIDLDEEDLTRSVVEEGGVDYEFNVDDEDEYIKYN
jgi:hypothetical protein